MSSYVFVIKIGFKLSMINLFSVLFFGIAEGDNTNALTYFSRGTVYLALGKANLALSDFDKVLELKPDFVGVSICF